MDGLTPEDEEKRLKLLKKYSLVEDDGDWGEIVQFDGGLDSEIEVRNPVEAPAFSAAERKLIAVRMKRTGASYRAIGDYFGVNATTARKMVQDTLKEELQENAAELRSLHYNRLEVMLGVHWDRMLTGDPIAFDKVGHTMDRIERLYGLSAPNKTEHVSSTRETIVIAEGDSDTYLRALKAAAAERLDIVDAEVVDGDDDADDDDGDG